MADLKTQPLTAERGAYRVEPYAQPSSDPSLASLPKSVARSAGVGSGTPGDPSFTGAEGIDNEGDITPEDLGHLQNAAANGDKESWDILNALKLPLGIAAGAAALFGTAAAGTHLVNSVANSKGINMVPNGRNAPGVTTYDPVRDGMNHFTPKQGLLPAPATGPIPQPDLSTPQLQLPDQRTAYQKSGGKLPTGAAAGEALREAARALRRTH